MEFDWLALARLAVLAIGVFLLALALLVAAKLRLPGRAWLATFLALVGAGYVVEAFAALSGRPGWNLALYASILDPVALMLFALSLQRAPASRWTRIALALGPLFIVAAAVLVLDPNEDLGVADAGRLRARQLSALVFVPYYLMALALAASAHHESRHEVEGDIAARVVVALATITLSRIPLVSTDLGWVSAAGRNELRSMLYLELPLALLAVAFALLFVRTAPGEAKQRARRTATQASLLLTFIAAAWALRFVPVLFNSTAPLLYPIRWLVFAGLIAFGLRRFELLGVPARLGWRLRHAFAALVGFVFLMQAASMLAHLMNDTGGALVGAGILLTLFGVGGAAFLQQTRRADEGAWRRARVYRAHLELGASDADLARLREELGLTLGEAREEERLAALAARMPAASLDRPTAGSVFARRYDVTRVLGAGAYGLVYDAFDRIEQRRVVLKELRPDWRATPDATERLMREAEVALRVSNPHLVRFLELERATEGHVLVLEHVEGETLAARLARGPLSGREASGVAADVLDGLASLHAAGIVHRDVKPENIILRPGGDAVLIDLGAALPESDSGTRPAGLAHTGTPRYMSPEAQAGARMTPASDLYSLGAVLREAVGAEREAEAWRALLEKATHEDPALRFVDARAFRAALPAA